MQVSDQKVVTLNYVLKDDDGNTMDASQDGTFSYLHGAQNIIPGLENALTGREPGETLSVAIPAAEAYGERDPSRIQPVPREMFPADVDIQPGMQFQAQGPDGQTMLVTVAEVREDVVVVDGNHPLAGVALNFDVEIIDVRDATPEEIAHGHVHG